METSRLIDVNALAIFLVENHPGHSYVEPRVRQGLEGSYQLMVPAHFLLRARWVMTRQWGVPRGEADGTLRAFLGHSRVRYVGGDRGALLKAYELAESLAHDVYDTHLLALAMENGAGGLLTTDMDFHRLCSRVGLEYENPVPRAVLKKFRGFKGA